MEDSASEPQAILFEYLLSLVLNTAFVERHNIGEQKVSYWLEKKVISWVTVTSCILINF